MTDVRVRFCPSPTGNLHVGNVRTALFNWAYARHTGGTFVFRIEDTDAARDSEDSYAGLLDSLRWLGLDWDEGPEVGGDHGPYRQSERFDLYGDVARKLVESGHAYYAYDTPEELEERREKARAEGRSSGYDGLHRDLTDEQRAAYEAEGRKPVIRFRMPDVPITFTDLVRGEMTFEPEHVSDYVLVRANGQPLYTLTNPVDDATMGITHVLRGEDLLSSTPRQIPLHVALIAVGVSQGVVPHYGHLPFVMGPGNRKLSKRDPGGGLQTYRERGFLPEGLLNYLALLGWSIGNDRELFTLQEMAEAFEIERVNPNPAQFDLKKCEAINGMKIRELSADDLADRLVPYLRDADLVGGELTPEQHDLLTAATPLVQERMAVLSEAVDMLGFLFVADDAFDVDPDEAAKAFTADGLEVVRTSIAALSALEPWNTASIEAALRGALIDGMGLKPRKAFAPVRVAVTGKKISPPLFESLELLGREKALARLRAALTRAD
ncbi:glutamate--tRNA ligase [Solicola gregarius]|uniref:Glutamate--tRNA ligase n=1 Tax=Solicola gregarius TaxID=2908642 RepID=A0AA46TIB3_9ACTN|nr:glutamate--tRNA ligase [Solicola gregarius]UYM05721.1 glutamate--tRNA ligase [Solicola gregarius]